MSKLRIMNASGDTTMEWTSADTATVEEVRQKFNELIESGYSAYSTSGTDSTMIRKFDPDAEQIVMSPRLVGG